MRYSFETSQSRLQTPGAYISLCRGVFAGSQICQIQNDAYIVRRRLKPTNTAATALFSEFRKKMSAEFD
uniref:Uncharacterized protein n=1 Tax=Caenorhabditis japonica TaxID=281687 RepID=A0A8R1E5A4_CAEJA